MGTENFSVIERIGDWVNQLLADSPEHFLVKVKIKPTNNIKVYVDGDKGITIEQCVHLNRKLYKLIEESAMYADGDFSLEVSSPGVDEPLQLQRQYHKNVGRFIEIVFTNDDVKEGKLIAVAEADILLEHTEGKGKKAITQQLVIPFTEIKKATIQIKF
ncbi:MAG TPA: ribosome maturation factor [Chitinophagaceae bacterium]|nr:ribosome maturation factor [Chitinophagaceae bacterium]HAN38087.1 ribosome maturation factor [Chitinophagaceae bacterium]